MKNSKGLFENKRIETLTILFLIVWAISFCLGHGIAQENVNDGRLNDHKTFEEFFPNGSTPVLSEAIYLFYLYIPVEDRMGTKEGIYGYNSGKDSRIKLYTIRAGFFLSTIFALLLLAFSDYSEEIPNWKKVLQILPAIFLILLRVSFYSYYFSTFGFLTDL